MKLSAVLFDMDGTLIDSEPYWLAAETELMSRYGYAWTEFDQQFCLGGPLPKVGRYMHEKARGAESPEFFEETLVDLVSAKFDMGLSYMPGAMEILSIVQGSGLPSALVSASPRLLVDRALELFGEDLFATSVANSDVVNSKPDPESYLLAAKRLGVNISECLVIEDSKTGIAAGLASGAHVLGVPHLVSIDPAQRLTLRDGLVGLTLCDLEAIAQSGHQQQKEQ